MIVNKEQVSRTNVDRYTVLGENKVATSIVTSAYNQQVTQTVIQVTSVTVGSSAESLIDRDCSEYSFRDKKTFIKFL